LIYALNKTDDVEMKNLAAKVKAGTVNQDEIARLVAFAKESGGIDYAEQRMNDFHCDASLFIERFVDNPSLKAALNAYLDFVIKRSS
jgi:octaprenyl-diphosphate synthase